MQLWRFNQADGAKCAHFTGVQLCGSIWTCPVCGPRIRQLRALDVDAASEKWLEQHGAGTVHLLTLTLPHQLGERLQAVLGAVRQSFQAITAGAAWTRAKAKFSLRHFIRSHDVTVGAAGWHPHIHAILFTARALAPAELEQLRLHFRDRWISAVATLGRKLPTDAHGVTLETARSRGDVVRYVMQVVTGEGEKPAAVAMELTRGDLKTSRHAGQRTPWQLLQDYRAGRSLEDLRLWYEYEKATRRVHAIRWSRGLRQAVGLSLELTDHQLLALGDRAGRFERGSAEQKMAMLYKPGTLADIIKPDPDLLQTALELGSDRELVATFTTERWRELALRPGVPAGLLEAAELGGQLGVARFLKAVELQERVDRIDRLGYRPSSLTARPIMAGRGSQRKARGTPPVMIAPCAAGALPAGESPARLELEQLLRADQCRPDYATVATPDPEISSRPSRDLHTGDHTGAARGRRRIPAYRLHRA